MNKDQRNQIAYEIFVKSYEYEDLNLKSGLVFYKKFQDKIIIKEIRSRESSLYFLGELYEAIRELYVIHNKPIYCYINQKQNNKLLNVALKSDATIVNVIEDNYLLKYEG